MILTTIAVVLRVLSNPLSNVFQKKLTGDGMHPLVVNFLSYLVLSLITIPLIISHNWQSFTTGFWLWAMLMGVLGAMGNGFLVMALQGGELSVLGPINAYKSVVGIIVGFLLLGELPSWLGLLGVMIIVWGSYFVMADSNSDKKLSWGIFKQPAIRYRVYAMVFSAIEAVVGKNVILMSDVNICFLLWCWMGMLFSGMMSWGILMGRKTKKFSFHLSLGQLGLLTLLPLSIGLMQYSTNYVFKHMDVGYALALFQLSAIVSIVFGYKLYHEKNIKRKLLGTTIMIAGAILIIFS